MAAPDWSRLAAFAEIAATWDAGDPVDPDAVRALGLPDNPGAALLLAGSLETAGRPDEAAAVLADLADRIAASASLSSLPKRYLKEIPRRRIRLLTQLGRLDDAERVRSEAAGAYPTDIGFADPAVPSSGGDQPADPAST